jgi:type I restriction enzyme, S subunit
MNAIQILLTDHIGIWTDADTEKKTGRGRSSGNADSVYGIRKLRELILDRCAWQARAARHQR